MIGQDIPDFSEVAAHSAFIIPHAMKMKESFLNKKASEESYQGYRVRVVIRDPKAPAEKWEFDVSVKGMGAKAPALREREKAEPWTLKCRTCASVFHHAISEYVIPKAHPFRNLQAAVEPYNMMPVFSLSNNLLLVPNKEPRSYKNLWVLKDEQLDQVFRATTAALFVLMKDGYVPDIEWHIGPQGGQTIDINHTRFQRMPKALVDKYLPARVARDICESKKDT